MKFLLLLIPLVLISCSSLKKENTLSCHEDSKRLKDRSEELLQLVNEDQNDRKDFLTKTIEQMQEVVRRDVTRRMRVGEIFGEGCFSKAQDFAAAALIYQHGSAPEHFYQTYIWAKRALELGDPSQERLMALGIDRYLVNIGKKQIYGSQAAKDNLSPDACWCLQQVEESFPDELRKKQTGKDLKEASEWVQELNIGKKCSHLQCTKNLEPTPRGSIPGIW